MIGKRVAWDSNFTIKSLEKEGLGKEHDPFIIFPFVELNGLRMEEIDNLICPPCNGPRGLREILAGIQEPLQNSLIEGWWVHSWLIPLLEGMYFDRRHTVKTIKKLIREKKIDAKYIPVADYERVYVDHEPLISSFETLSIIGMLAMLANVLKANDDAKGDHFFNSIVDIIDREDKIKGEGEYPELKSKEFIRRLLTYMGAYRRFSDAKGYVSTTLTDRIYDHYHVKAQPSAGQLTMNVEEENRNKFINDSDDWMDGCWNNNETDDKYMYRVFAIDNIKDHHRLIVEKIDQLIYKLDNDARNQPTVTQEILEPKTLKVLLWCKQTSKFEATHAGNVISSRDGFKKYYKSSFYNTRNSVTSKFQDVLPKNYEENCKHPSDYNLEIHFMPQIEDVEDEDKTILWEDMDLPSEFDNLNEEFEI
jgi:hypothetical protein